MARARCPFCLGSGSIIPQVSGNIPAAGQPCLSCGGAGWLELEDKPPEANEGLHSPSLPPVPKDFAQTRAGEIVGNAPVPKDPVAKGALTTAKEEEVEELEVELVVKEPPSSDPEEEVLEVELKPRSHSAGKPEVEDEPKEASNQEPSQAAEKTQDDLEELEVKLIPKEKPAEPEEVEELEVELIPKKSK